MTEQPTNGAVDLTEMERRVADTLENESRVWMNELSAEQSLTLARAAIRAMREPTDDMLSSCLRVPILGPHATGRDYDRAHYRAMIDTATATR